MTAHSSIGSLRRLSPACDAEAAAVYSVTGREELLAGVTRLPFGRGAQPRRATRRRRPLVLALAVVAAAATAAAAWAVLGSPPAQETTSVQCLIAGSDAIVPSTSGDPAHDCATEWKRDFGTAPPPLAAYDNGLGGVTVIPRGKKPPPSWKPLQSQDVALIELQDSLDDHIGGLNASCLDGKAATSLADAKLAEFGFRGWSVSVRSGAGTCVASDIVDAADQSVTLIPVSVQAGPEPTYQKLADRLRPITQKCESLSAAEASVQAAASSVGLSASDYQLGATADSTLRCASIFETVGGTIFLTIRGPSS
jgi:hypothetical protein